MKDAELEGAMWEALNSPLGVSVETTDPGLMRQRFYKIRKQHPEMKPLSAILPMTGNPMEVWIVKNSGEPDGPSQE